MKKSNPALDALKHHVTGAIERGEKQPIVEKRKYYTLVSKTQGDSTWAIEFGDYDRQTVVDELREQRYQDHFRDSHDRREFKIIVTHEDQRDIEAAVSALNGYEPDLIERHETFTFI